MRLAIARGNPDDPHAPRTHPSQSPRSNSPPCSRSRTSPHTNSRFRRRRCRRRATNSRPGSSAPAQSHHAPRRPNRSRRRAVCARRGRRRRHRPRRPARTGAQAEFGENRTLRHNRFSTTSRQDRGTLSLLAAKQSTGKRCSPFAHGRRAQAGTARSPFVSGPPISRARP